MNNIIGQFMRGLFVPLKGLAIIFSSPKKLFLSILPFMIGLGLLFLGIGWATSNLGGVVKDFLQQFLSSSGTWFQILGPILVFLTWAGFLTLGFLLVYVLISVLAGPFLSLLAEDVLDSEGCPQAKNSSLALMVRMFTLSLGKALFFLFIAGVSFILWFFPPLNFLGSFLVLLTIAFDCMDYSLEASFMGFRMRMQYFFRHFWLFSGLATSILCTTFLPGIFFLLLPAFVAGAAKIYVELELRKW